uniref:Major facilitator superfamily (MFS) profile domain-containing protein n=1 Tax=Ditylenchus dipsaci TaxID=166011 RepID=A0A915DW67_9BILA
MVSTKDGEPSSSDATDQVEETNIAKDNASAEVKAGREPESSIIVAPSADSADREKTADKVVDDTNMQNGTLKLRLGGHHLSDEAEEMSFTGSLDDHNSILPDGDYHSQYSINEFQHDGIRHETMVDHLPVPPDGGYGWVVVVGAFICNFFVDGVSNSFGPFMSFYQDAFQTSKATTSVIGSMLIGSLLLSGPIAGGLLNKYEAKKVVIGGTILASTALCLSTFSPNIYVHYVLYGLLGGIGLGFIYLPAIVCVSQYFETKRALATGLAVAGSGFGISVMPLLCKYLLESFGWKITLYIFAIMLLICALCAFVFKPLPVPEEQIKLSEEMKQQALLAALSRAEVGSSEEHSSSNGGEEDEQDGVGTATASPFKRNTFRTNSQCTNHADKEDGQPLLNNAESIAQNANNSEQKKENGIPLDDTPQTPTPLQLALKYIEMARKTTLTSMNSAFTSIAGGIDFRQSKPNLTSQLSRMSARSYAQSLSRISLAQPSIKGGDSILSVALSGIDPKEFNRPLSRRDVFLQGSIRNLKEFSDEGSNYKAYRESQISVSMGVVAQSIAKASQEGSDMAELSSRMGGSLYNSKLTIQGLGGLGADENDFLQYESASKWCSWIPFPIRNAFSDMIDLNLLKEPIMLLLCLSNILGMIGFYVPFVFIIDLAVAKNSNVSEATFLLSIIGITNTFGRVFFGWVADRQWVTALAINNWSLVFCGVLTCICPMLPNYFWLCIYSILFGFAVSAYICLTSIVLSDLLGVERLTNSFGLLVVSRGVASLLGTPLAGIVYDATNSYDASFYFAGTLIVLAGLVSCIIPIVHKHERSKLKNEGDYQPAKDLDVQSGKLSVLTERSEENLTEYQRTIQSLQQQKQLIRELEEYKKRSDKNCKVEEVNEESVDGEV